MLLLALASVAMMADGSFHRGSSDVIDDAWVVGLGGESSLEGEVAGRGTEGWKTIYGAYQVIIDKKDLQRLGWSVINTPILHPFSLPPSFFLVFANEGYLPYYHALCIEMRLASLSIRLRWWSM